jgi:hypothetical protein
MTERLQIEAEIASSMSKLRSKIDLEDTSTQEALAEVEAGIDKLTKIKYGKAKVFVACHPDGGIEVSSTVPLNVIAANLLRAETPIIESIDLEPLPEQVFLEEIHDALATQLQNGSLTPATLNQKINYGTTEH